jgi:hypothetical protein
VVAAMTVVAAVVAAAAAKSGELSLSRLGVTRPAGQARIACAAA